MTSLAQQLQNAKYKVLANRVDPNVQCYSILMDSQIAKHKSIDIIYTMAIMSYSNLKKHLAVGCQEHATYILSQDNKSINRNKLTKVENNTLSISLQKFLIYLSPYLLDSNCQKILEYLIRNYKINIFEGQVLIIMFLHFWKYPIFQKLCKIVQLKSNQYQFIKNIAQKQITLSFLIKNILYNHHILEQIILYGSQYYKLQSLPQQNIDIQIEYDQQININQQKNVIKIQSKRFIFEIFRYILNNKLQLYYKHIVRFVLEAVSQKCHNSQLISMAMILITQMITLKAANQTTINLLTKKIAKKRHQSITKSLKSNIYDFIIFIWQRGIKLTNQELINDLSSDIQFIKYLKHCNQSLFRIFRMLFKINNQKIQKLIQVIVIKVKTQDFVVNYYQQYYNDIIKYYFENRTLSRDNFVKKYLEYQLAQFINRNSNYNSKIIKLSFTSSWKQSSKGIDLTSIIRVMPPPKELKKIQTKDNFQSDEMQSQQSEKQVIPPKKSLRSHLCKQKVFVEKLNFSDEKVREGAMKLIQNYYQKQQEDLQHYISQQQKNSLLQNDTFLKSYTIQMFTYDIERQDWVTPIRYLLKYSNQRSVEAKLINKKRKNQDIVYIVNQTQQNIIKLIQSCFQKLLQKPYLFNDILFKQICRISTSILKTNLDYHYKQIIDLLNKLNNKFIQKYLSKKQELQNITNFTFKLSKNLFQQNLSHGKYFKLIYYHTKIISIMIIQQIAIQIIQKYYQILINTFTINNLYLINIGILELLTKSNINVKYLQRFIQIIIKMVKYNQKYTVEKFSLSVIRMLAFCQLLGGYSIKLQQKQSSQLQLHIYEGIAKKLISNFYGLTSLKQKKSIIKKILYFLSLLFGSKEYLKIFEQYLINISQKNKENQNYQLKQYQNIIHKQNITNLFSLQLRLTLFQPLLPNNNLFKILGQHLAQHHKFNSQQLKNLVNIIPETITKEWIRFATQCIHRKHSICNENVNILISRQSNLQKDQLGNLCQIICQLAQFNSNQILKILNSVINIIIKYLQSQDTNNNLKLAIILRIIKSLNDIISPYLEQIFNAAIKINTQYTDIFLQQFTQSLSKPTLISLIKNTYENVNNYENYTKFLNIIMGKNIKLTFIQKIIQNYLIKIINKSIQQQNLQFLSTMQNIIADGFKNMALNLKQQQLRKLIINFISWSQKQLNLQNMLSVGINIKKSIILIIYQKLSSKLGLLFINFHGYIFQGLIKDIINYTNIFVSVQSQKTIKRKKNLSNFQQNYLIYYLKIILKVLQNLFINDKDHQFLDIGKFEDLQQPLINIFLINCIGQSYNELINQYLCPCLLKLCSYLQDDYQLKSINYKIMLLLRHKSITIQIAIYGYFQRLIDIVKDRYLIIVNDLARFLIETIKNRNQKLVQLAQKIIYKIKDISGEDLQNYLQ